MHFVSVAENGFRQSDRAISFFKLAGGQGNGPRLVLSKSDRNVALPVQLGDR